MPFNTFHVPTVTFVADERLYAKYSSEETDLSMFVLRAALRTTTAGW